MIGRAAAGRTTISHTPPTTIRQTIDDGWSTFRSRTTDLLRPILTFVTHLIRIARWVLERVAVIEPVEWFAWRTAGDERTCPECGPLDGRTWPETHAMPAPPLHVNCRCRIVHARTEWRVRHIPTWQLQWSTRRLGEWTRTGWA
jgi:SPP1 gp7 family putative phage head morphogenesis protein